MKEAIGKMSCNGSRFLLEQESDGNVQDDMEDLPDGPFVLEGIEDWEWGQSWDMQSLRDN